MLYNGSTTVFEQTDWVVFDEIHYLNDYDRGVVWEEVLILLPKHIGLVMLSATVSNLEEFGEWVGRTKQNPVYTVSTAFRPTPLQHKLYWKGEFFEVMDGKTEKFNANLWKAVSAFEKEIKNKKKEKDKRLQEKKLEVEVEFDKRPFGMTPASTGALVTSSSFCGPNENDDNKALAASAPSGPAIGYRVEKVNTSDFSKPANKLGIKPGWVLVGVIPGGKWECDDWIDVSNSKLDEIKELLKTEDLPIRCKFRCEEPPVSGDGKDKDGKDGKEGKDGGKDGGKNTGKDGGKDGKSGSSSSVAQPKAKQQSKHQERVPPPLNPYQKTENESRELQNLLRILKSEDKLPATVFVFSRKKCLDFALKLPPTLDFATRNEKYKIHQFLERSLAQLEHADLNLPQIQLVARLVMRGIGFHHAGLLPVVKELTEILFSAGLIKVLFATETFAMGVNMPARSVIFTQIEKHDGQTFRTLLPSEYTQMAGRAGRRGLDDVGHVFLLAANELPDRKGLTDMLLKNANPLRSQFRITYKMILSLARFGGGGRGYGMGHGGSGEGYGGFGNVGGEFGSLDGIERYGGPRSAHARSVPILDMIAQSFSESDRAKQIPTMEKSILSKTKRIRDLGFDCMLDYFREGKSVREGKSGGKRVQDLPEMAQLPVLCRNMTEDMLKINFSTSENNANDSSNTVSGGLLTETFFKKKILVPGRVLLVRLGKGLMLQTCVLIRNIPAEELNDIFIGVENRVTTIQRQSEFDGAVDHVNFKQLNRESSKESHASNLETQESLPPTVSQTHIGGDHLLEKTGYFSEQFLVLCVSTTIDKEKILGINGINGDGNGETLSWSVHGQGTYQDTSGTSTCSSAFFLRVGVEHIVGACDGVFTIGEEITELSSPGSGGNIIKRTLNEKFSELRSLRDEVREEVQGKNKSGEHGKDVTPVSKMGGTGMSGGFPSIPAGVLVSDKERNRTGSMRTDDNSPSSKMKGQGVFSSTSSSSLLPIPDLIPLLEIPITQLVEHVTSGFKHKILTILPLSKIIGSKKVSLDFSQLYEGFRKSWEAILENECSPYNISSSSVYNSSFDTLLFENGCEAYDLSKEVNDLDFWTSEKSLYYVDQLHNMSTTLMKLDYLRKKGGEEMAYSGASKSLSKSSRFPFALADGPKSVFAAELLTSDELTMTEVLFDLLKKYIASPDDEDGWWGISSTSGGKEGGKEGVGVEEKDDSKDGKQNENADVNGKISEKVHIPESERRWADAVKREPVPLKDENEKDENNYNTDGPNGMTVLFKRAGAHERLKWILNGIKDEEEGGGGGGLGGEGGLESVGTEQDSAAAEQAFLSLMSGEKRDNDRVKRGTDDSAESLKSAKVPKSSGMSAAAPVFLPDQYSDQYSGSNQPIVQPIGSGVTGVPGSAGTLPRYNQLLGVTTTLYDADGNEIIQPVISEQTNLPGGDEDPVKALVKKRLEEAAKNPPKTQDDLYRPRLDAAEFCAFLSAFIFQDSKTSGYEDKIPASPTEFVHSMKRKIKTRHEELNKMQSEEGVVFGEEEWGKHVNLGFVNQA